MNYYLNEVRDINKRNEEQRHAGGKARWDISTILSGLKFEPIDIELQETERETAKNYIYKMYLHVQAAQKLKTAFQCLKTGDTIYIQFPIFNHSIFNGSLLKKLRKKDIHVVLIIHDLTMLRDAKYTTRFCSKFAVKSEELEALKSSEKIIVHNESMKAFLLKLGISADKMVVLKIFDYLLPLNASMPKTPAKDCGVIIAGNLVKQKAEYIYHLPGNIQWNLYGVGYEDEVKSNVDYCGSFLPEELVEHLHGGFGLVWDGKTAETCSGVYGEYMRINNPHKTSLYLAAGLPVIIWKEAALAPLVEELQVGITVSSLYEIKEKIDSLTEAEYAAMKKNVERISQQLRTGYYLRTAIQKVSESEQ